MSEEKNVSATKLPSGAFAGTKVFIVDDDDFLLNMYSIKFKKEGLIVDTATSGLSALVKLREGYQPDLLLCDVIMPAMDGLEFLENVRIEKLAEKTVFVVLTNQSQQTDIERAKKIGVHGYIIKASSIPSEVVTETLKILSANRAVAK